MEPPSPSGLAAAFRRAFRREEVDAEEDRAESLAHDREGASLKRADAASLPVNTTAARAAWFKLWLAAGFANSMSAGPTLSASLLGALRPLLPWLSLALSLAAWQSATTARIRPAFVAIFAGMQSVSSALEHQGIADGVPGLSTAASYTALLAVALLVWLFLTPAFALHVTWHGRFPESRLSTLVFPCCWTTLWALLTCSFSPIGAYPSPASTQAAYPLICAMASFGGSLSVLFVMAWVASTLSLQAWRGRGRWSVLALAALFLIAAVSEHIGGGELAGIAQPTPLSATCLFRVADGSRDAIPEDEFWADTETHLRDAEAHSALVMWSETAVYVQGAEGEAKLLKRAEKAARHGAGAYLGVSYAVMNGEEGPHQNVFALLRPGAVANASGGALAFRYVKAHPVPLVEAHFEGGARPLTLPFEDAPFGRISAAICFDFDFPELMHQASAGGATLLLQPAQTWGSSAFRARHLRGNSLRAAEGGFTLLRCASDGVSGVVGPRGELVSASRTGSSGEAAFLLGPLARRETLYAQMPPALLSIFCAAATLAACVVLVQERRERGAWAHAEERGLKSAGRLGALESAGDFSVGAFT